MRRRLSIAAVMLVLAGTAIGHSRAADQRAGGPAAPPATAAAKIDISGFWELAFDSRKSRAASLRPSVTRAKIEARAKADARAIRWCNQLGLPFTMDSGRPLDIRQGSTAVIIVPENASSPRYLYLN